MHALAPGITVNGVSITPDQISAEVQYHPAESLLQAKYEAMQALVIRELLVQEAVAKGIAKREEINISHDAAIEKLLKQEISLPVPTDEECRRYYENNPVKFHTSPLFEVSHILYLAPPDNKKARAEALKRAEKTLERISKKASLFKSIAREESGCPSAKDGGRLGQIGKGQTMPAFEAALMKMQAGDISLEPVASEVGYHIIKVHERAEGNRLPFEAVAEWISKTITEQSWRRAFGQYVQILAGKAKISGFKLKASDSPLVQ
ncbi:MAG: peptidylprolyl isomerase [Rhodospirillales bacterium]|nr:peptidylprolyl isomerase [Alphaproteobacteria bacterium]MCB9986809.1 peptidylprolyl isomerase [Rhodospirillales bacterium]USO08426.1 MAG: peptidylprolyl isomerase [Rhodospirillales bacterium]